MYSPFYSAGASCGSGGCLLSKSYNLFAIIDLKVVKGAIYFFHNVKSNYDNIIIVLLILIEFI